MRSFPSEGELDRCCPRAVRPALARERAADAHRVRIPDELEREEITALGRVLWAALGNGPTPTVHVDATQRATPHANAQEHSITIPGATPGREADWRWLQIFVHELCHRALHHGEEPATLLRPGPGLTAQLRAHRWCREVEVEWHAAHRLPGLPGPQRSQLANLSLTKGSRHRRLSRDSRVRQQPGRRAWLFRAGS